MEIRMNEKLEQEIERYLHSIGLGYGGWADGLGDDDLRELARHFAQWQKEQDEEIINAIGDIPGDIEKAYNNGRKDMREQMMKEAVEARVCSGMEGDKWIMTYVGDYESMIKLCKAGDKVRIIIIKED